jgi:parallel beta-helix repeat protein
MTWTDDTFDFNQAYGFDPHDFSDHFLVRDSLALRNGRHGFIFSRGCVDNVIVGNTAELNRGHGFMIDDGRSTVTVGPRRMVPSSHNLLSQNRAFDNGHSGIEIEGGRGNTVRRNRLVGNFVGIRYRDAASGDIEANAIRRSRLYGLDIESTAGRVTVRHNVATGSWSDFTAGRPVAMSANQFDVIQARSSANGRRELTGVLAQSAAFLEFRPGVTVWLVVLVVPLAALGARGGILLATHRTRRSRDS